MKHQRKLDHCLNCGNALPTSENYCPECGQENKDQKVPLAIFLEELLTSLFSFDGKFLQTLTAFFFQPGKLTQSFNKGQRKNFTHPIRLYLVFSLFYFFMIGFLVPKDFFDRLLNAGHATLSAVQQERSPEQHEEPDPETRERIEEALKKAEPISPVGISILQNSAKGAQSPTYTWKTLRFLSFDPAVSLERFG